MKQTHDATRRTLFSLLAALCLSAGAAAQTTKENAKESSRETTKEFKPTREQKSEAARLRTALADALGENFEIVSDRLVRRSNYHGGGLYWLAHLRAARPGGFHVKYKYRYKDHVHPEDPLYTFVERGEPVTILSSRENVHGYTERFSSNSGEEYRTTPLVLQPGDRITLEYFSYSHRGRTAGGENKENLEASVKDYPPVITMFPFDFDPAQDFNEWLAGFLPPRAIMRPTKRGR